MGRSIPSLSLRARLRPYNGLRRQTLSTNIRDATLGEKEREKNLEDFKDLLKDLCAYRNLLCLKDSPIGHPPMENHR